MKISHFRIPSLRTIKGLRRFISLFITVLFSYCLSKKNRFYFLSFPRYIAQSIYDFFYKIQNGSVPVLLYSRPNTSNRIVFTMIRWIVNVYLYFRLYRIAKKVPPIFVLNFLAFCKLFYLL